MLEVNWIQEKAVNSNVNVRYFLVSCFSPEGCACNITGPPLLLNEMFDELPWHCNSLDPVCVHDVKFFILKQLLRGRQPLTIVPRTCATKLNLQTVFWIPDIEGFVVLQKASAFLKNEISQLKFDSKNIVVSHHVPTLMNYPPKYKRSELSQGFAAELSDLIVDSNISNWIYGHHHFNTPDFVLGKTVMRTNQLGYTRQHEHASYKRNALFEL